MSEWTPGPWFAVNVGTKDEPMMEVRAARIAGREPRHCVALCATGDSSQPMENANARLIAAAPLMHDVLVRARYAIEALDGTTVENEKLVDDYHAARRAAEGKS